MEGIGVCRVLYTSSLLRSIPPQSLLYIWCVCVFFLSSSCPMTPAVKPSKHNIEATCSSFLSCSRIYQKSIRYIYAYLLVYTQTLTVGGTGAVRRVDDAAAPCGRKPMDWPHDNGRGGGGIDSTSGASGHRHCSHCVPRAPVSATGVGRCLWQQRRLPARTLYAPPHFTRLHRPQKRLPADTYPAVVMRRKRTSKILQRTSSPQVPRGGGMIADPYRICPISLVTPNFFNRNL